jgi:hypothetical protein
MDDKKKPKSLHPFDSWPPPRKKGNETIPLSKKLPRNVSYRDPNEEQIGTSDMAVYEAEMEQQELQQEGKNDHQSNQTQNNSDTSRQPKDQDKPSK